MDEILAIAVKMLGATPERWISLAATTPDSLLDRAPAPDEWSAKACLGHLRDTERDVFPARVRAFLAGQDFPAFNPDAESTPLERQTTSELAQEFARLRAASLAVLAAVTDADLARTARHSQLGQVTLSQLVHEWVAHDLMHTVQGERAMMQPFITDCGPWQIYFTDHIAGAALNRE
jgi:DinB family protein